VVRANGAEYGFPPYPAGLRAILADGGLIPHLMRNLERTS
jgi:hypothetical protein